MDGDCRPFCVEEIEWHLIWQVTVDALGMSMIYVLLAVGLNLIITTTRIVLVAYGNFYMIGAYAVWFLVSPLKFRILFLLRLQV